jgi:hypothetical protein
MECGESAHRVTDDVRLLDLQGVHHRDHIVARDILTVFRTIVRNIGWWIPTLAIGDATVRAGEVPHLHLPRAVVAGKLMNENNWRAYARFLVVKPGTVPCGDVRHHALRYSGAIICTQTKAE